MRRQYSHWMLMESQRPALHCGIIYGGSSSGAYHRNRTVFDAPTTFGCPGASRNWVGGAIGEKEKKPYQGLPVEKNKTCWLLAQQAHHSKSFAVFFITGFLCTTLLTWWAAWASYWFPCARVTMGTQSEETENNSYWVKNNFKNDVNVHIL